MDLHHKQIQDMINNVNGGSVLKGYVKTVCVKIFNCAIVDYELPININIVSSLEIGNRSASNKHIPFTNEALITLLNNYYNEIVMTLLIQCFSGMRPNELFETDKEHIYINEDYIIGGSKTTAGKNRIIPIHPYIKPFIEYFLKKDSLYPFKEAINNFNYSKYGRMVKKLMLNLNIKHNNGQIPTAYDCRHTFTTLMKKANANEYILKRIVGHSIKDITEKTYTHRDIDELIREVQKIKLPYFDNFIEGVNLS